MAAIDRRRFLQGAAVAAGGVTVGGLVESARSSATTGAPTTSPFHGLHQAGVLDSRQPNACFVAFDVTARSSAELTSLMRTLTESARFLTRGGAPRDMGIAAPAADSGILGPDIPADGLTILVSVGASLFDHRFGLSDRKPRRLRVMDTFPNDNLDRARCDGDLLIQLGATNADTVVHALRDLCRSTRGLMQPRWRIDGFCPPPRPTGSPRNLMGFKDGSANPDPTDSAAMDRLVWVQPGSDEPEWATAGTYHVVRVIEMLVEFWDRVDTGEQERIIGRRKDTGAPLSGSRERDTPDYSDDPSGATTPLDSHIRLANPRTAHADATRILRRSYSFDGGIGGNGDLEMGLLFTCFQRDLDRQFVAIQKRLADEPLVDYVSPVGGGYFFALPGVRDTTDFYAGDLLA